MSSSHSAQVKMRLLLNRSSIPVAQLRQLKRSLLRSNTRTMYRDISEAMVANIESIQKVASTIESRRLGSAGLQERHDISAAKRVGAGEVSVFGWSRIRGLTYP